MLNNKGKGEHDSGWAWTGRCNSASGRLFNSREDVNQYNYWISRSHMYPPRFRSVTILTSCIIRGGNGDLPVLICFVRGVGASLATASVVSV